MAGIAFFSVFGIVGNMAKKKMTIEDLARMVNRGFDGVTEKMATKGELRELRRDLTEALRIVEDDVRDIKITMGPLVRIVGALEYDMRHLHARMNRVEKKVGLSR